MTTSISTKLESHRNESLSQIKLEKESERETFNQQLSSIANGLIGYNKFITEFNFIENRFTTKINLMECLGYTDHEFTVKSLNNDSQSIQHFTHPDDIEHKIRYDMITYSLLATHLSFSTLNDYYKVTFRVKHKAGYYMRVERSVYLFRTNPDGIPISQLSIWEVSNNTLDYVKPTYYAQNNDDVMALFYKKNTDYVGLKFTPTERKILKLKSKYLMNKEVQYTLGIKSQRTLEKHIENMIKKLRDFLENRNEDSQINSIYEVLHYANLYGLFPFYPCYV